MVLIANNVELDLKIKKLNKSSENCKNEVRSVHAKLEDKPKEVKVKLFDMEAQIMVLVADNVELEVKLNEAEKKLSNLKEQIMVLMADSAKLNHELHKFNKRFSKGKGEASNLQLELEDKLAEADVKLSMALERNAQLEKDLVQAKKS
ncbi:uncharacterized protein LOC129891595 [Solanum dulcamara]|uniref:uncharacterized protein LOC129891595 n=1 Tax=Solanum dulcamara TaxID=45834 RepID=UPI00248668AE|nr:uncharacterized protein LOC129891595 [Solanum dulcamara]